MINGQVPGPLIEANWGDWIEVTIHNEIPDEGASVHWHGFLQKGTQTYDGLPGIEQCPIAPGTSLTYRFQASLYGSTWYHSHYSSQYASGLVGPITVYGPKNVPYDVDVGPVMLSDWYHQYYQTGVDMALAPLPYTAPPIINNVLINGKNNYDCSQTNLTCMPNAGLANFNFTSGKAHRLRLINPSGAATMKFSIDDHVMTVMANDFVEIHPYQTQVVTLGVGQRTDVIVYANASSTGAFWMRAFAPPNCWPVDEPNNYAQAAIYYENANRTALPTSQAVTAWDNTNCGNVRPSLYIH